MIITKKQKEHLLDTIVDIELALSSLIREIDSENEAYAAGSILEGLALINSALIHSKVEETERDKELFF